MKIPHLPNGPRSRGFTLIELLVVISIIAILAGFALPVFTSAQKKGRITDSLNNAKQTSTALKMFAGDHEGAYPFSVNPDGTGGSVADSNTALEQLMPRYSSNKTIFGNKSSAWCKTTSTVATDATNQYKLLQGQCDWSYVAGLAETSESRWPLMATAFSEGGEPTYVKQTSKKGGVWAGTDAVVVFVDHSAKQISEMGGATTDAPFIKRPDDPTKNLFKKESDWLDGDTVVLVHPKK